MKKGLSKVISAVMIAAMATMNVASPASASTHDSNFSMSMSPGPNDSTADAGMVIVKANSINYETMYFSDRYSRTKDSTSSIYLYISSSQYGSYPMVGIYGLSDSYRFDFATYCSNGDYHNAITSQYCKNKTGTSSAVLTVQIPNCTGTYLITNMVRESGYHNAALGMSAAGTVTGAWSPDSSGSYTTLS